MYERCYISWLSDFDPLILIDESVPSSMPDLNKRKKVLVLITVSSRVNEQHIQGQCQIIDLDLKQIHVLQQTVWIYRDAQASNFSGKKQDSGFHIFIYF